MQQIQDITEWRRIRQTLPTASTVGFVPTMGNLHKGHISLITESQKENHITIASIFINPTQFNQREDFENYPRTLDADLALLTEAGVEYCLLPDEKTMYADRYAYQTKSPDGGKTKTWPFRRRTHYCNETIASCETPPGLFW